MTVRLADLFTFGCTIGQLQQQLKEQQRMIIIDYLLCYMNAFLFGVIVGVGIMILMDVLEVGKA